MRQLAISAISALALLSVITGSSGAVHVRSKATAGCTPGHAHLIAADTQAQVYSIRKNDEEIEYRGCVYGRSRSFEVGFTEECLSSHGGCGGTSHIVLTGVLVAREESVNTPVQNEWLVEVEDLRNGHILHRVPTGAPLMPEPGYIGVGNVVAIVVKKNGSVAWIADDSERSSKVGSFDEVRYFDLGIADKSGDRLLASGTNIDPSSLALAGSTLYWTQGGKPASAPLH